MLKNPKIKITFEDHKQTLARMTSFFRIFNATTSSVFLFFANMTLPNVPFPRTLSK